MPSVAKSFVGICSRCPSATHSNGQVLDVALLQSLIDSGRIVDLMLTVLAVELVVVQIYRRRAGGGIGFLPMLLNLGAGGSLMLALRAALISAGPLWIAVFLLSSLVFHVADQAARWESPVDR